MNNWLGDLASSLQERERQHSFRSRRVMQGACKPEVFFGDQACLNFSSNDYLGLANHPAVKQAAKSAIDKFGVGSGASHLVTGHHQLHQQLESRLAKLTGREAALFLGSGFQANMTVLQTLLRKGDQIFQDRLNHASLIDGALHSSAKLMRYRHGDMEHLIQLLASNTSENTQHARRIIASDSVFSMDGDLAPARRLAEIAAQHDAILMLDDAHGFGVLGDLKGAGIVESENLNQVQLPILMATLGKSVGVQGAFIAGSKTLIDMLVNESRSYIYSTAQPPALAAAALASLDIIENEPERRKKLRQLVERYQSGLRTMGLEPTHHKTPIQVLILGSNEDALAVSSALQEQGIVVSAIRPPTVPAGTARLRITFSAAHSVEDVDKLLSALEFVLPASGVMQSVQTAADFDGSARLA